MTPNDLREGARLLLQYVFYPSDRAIAERLIALADSMEKAAPVAWVMVPREATNAMYRAWCRGNVDWRQRYEDMLAAAPAPPAPVATVDEKVARAKLDNEAYQRGYADGAKHDAPSPAEGEFGALVDRLIEVEQIYGHLVARSGAKAKHPDPQARTAVLNAYAARAKDAEDAARLDWLASRTDARMDGGTLHVSFDNWIPLPDGCSYALDEDGCAPIRPDDLRAAIDAARAGEVGK